MRQYEHNLTCAVLSARTAVQCLLMQPVQCSRGVEAQSMYSVLQYCTMKYAEKAVAAQTLHQCIRCTIVCCQKALCMRVAACMHASAAVCTARPSSQRQARNRSKELLAVTVVKVCGSH
eukprot:3160-Heterococcus_DN1.PRE.4